MSLTECMTSPTGTCGGTVSEATGTINSFSVSISGGTAPFSYSWYFGDFEYSTSASPSHSYDWPGSFVVSVEVTDAKGQVDVAASLTVSTSWASGCQPFGGHLSQDDGYSATGIWVDAAHGGVMSDGYGNFYYIPQELMGGCYSSPTMSVQVEGGDSYWSVTYNDPGAINYVLSTTLEPSYDAQNCLPSFVGFSNTADSTYTWETSVSNTATFTATVAGNGGSTSSTYTETAGATGSGGLEECEYEDNLGTILQNSATSWGATGIGWYNTGISYTGAPLMPDYYTPTTTPTASSCAVVGPGYTKTVSVTVSGSNSLQAGIDLTLDLSVDAGPITIGTSIPIDIVYDWTESATNDFSIAMKNPQASGNLYFAWYVESSGVPHVWQVNNCVSMTPV